MLAGSELEKALKGYLKWANGVILVALNICPGASTIKKPLYFSGFQITTFVHLK
jgi:hypothetical protein